MALSNSIPIGFGGLDGKVSDSRHRQMEGRYVSAFKPIECATVLDGSESEPGSEAKSGPAPADTEAFQRAEQPTFRSGLVVSTERYPPAFIARWRKGTSPHSNRLNAQRCSMAVKANQDQRPKADPRQPIPKLSSGQNNQHPDRVWRSRRKGIRQPSSPDGGKARFRIQLI